MATKKEENIAEKRNETGGSDKPKTCFVIMPISDVPGYDNGHFRRVYDFIIKPACEIAGYRVERADDVRSSNVIMIGVLKQILEADMAICDLSSRNPNVLYELAIRQCFGLPVTLLRDSSTTEPFDVAGIRYTEYDKQLRIDLVNEAVKNVADSIIATERMRDTDVFSLLQLLGRDKATTKSTDVDPIFYTLLDEISSIKSAIRQNPPSVDTSPSFVNQDSAIATLNRVINPVYYDPGINLKGADSTYASVIPDDYIFGDLIKHVPTNTLVKLVGTGMIRQGRLPYLALIVKDGPGNTFADKVTSFSSSPI